MDDELEMCREALGEIISKCESYKGLASKYEQEKNGEAPPPAEDAEPSLEIEIDAATPEEEMADDHDLEQEPAPLSVVDRPAARMPNMPRKRGRPRKGSY